MPMHTLLLLCAVVVFARGTNQTEFSALVADYWAWRMEDAPEFATAVEVHTYDYKAEDYSIDILDQRKSKVDGFMQTLNTIDRSRLGPVEQTSYDVLQDTLLTYQAGYRWKNYGPMSPVNFLDGLWTNPGAGRPADPRTRDDFMNFTARITDWGDQALNMMMRLQRAINESTTNNWVSMERALPQLEDLIGDGVMDNVLYEPFNSSLDNTSLSADIKTQIRSKAIIAVEHFRESFDVLTHFVNTTYREHARKAYGVSAFPEGEAYYRACLKWHLSEDRDPAEIHALGRREVERIYGEMQTILDRLKFTGTVKQFFDSLKNYSEFFLKTPEETIKRFEDIIFKRIKPKLPQYFKNIPNMPVKVEEMPSDGPGGTYSFGSPDGSRPGIFYANVKRPEDNPTYSMVALTLHEADPGHHLQDIFSQAAPGLEMFRKVVDDSKYFSPPLHFPFYTAFGEGWALYAESLGQELGIYQDDYELMGRYSSEIFRACRLVVDTGLHYYNWTRERAVEYMLNYTAESEPKLNLEVDRYITWPGQACAYKVGELKIRELRNVAETLLGNKFDIREFHSVVLENGNVPLKVLEELVLSWIADRKAVSYQAIFDALVDEYWAWRLQDSPEFATEVGVHDYDDRVEKYTIEVLDDRKDKVDWFLQRLSKIDRSQLEPSKQVSYDVLQDTLQTYHDGYMWKNYGPMNPVNFLEGLYTKPKTAYPSDPRTVIDFMNYTSRIQGFGEQALNMKNRMERAINESTTNHWVSMKAAVSAMEEFIGTSDVGNAMYAPFNETLEGSFLTSTQKSSIRESAVAAVSRLRSSYSQLNNFVNGTYRGSARTAYGVSAFPKGEAYYRACLRWHLSEERDPAEIHALGLSEVERIYGEMQKILNRLHFTGSVKQFFDSLKNNESFILKTPEATLQRFDDIINKRVKPQLSSYFKNIPDHPVKVEEMPTDGPGGSYTFGSPDGSRPGIFYANVRRPEDNPTYTMVALTLHEADPGHHMQDIYSQAASGLEMFRKVVDDSKYFSSPLHFPIYTAYLEGWALYAESLGQELGIYEDDYELMGRYSSEIFRACRLVVDTGLHYYNWTRQTAIDYMLNYTADSDTETANEIDRYITWPGQACAYKVGELKIRALRTRAETELGNRFDIRDFHSVVLENGPVPLKVLEQLVEDYITKAKAQPADTFAKIVQDYWAWRLEDAPEFATEIQVSTYDDRVEQYTIPVLDERKNMVEGYLNRLRKLDVGQLSSSDKISYDILTDTLHTYLDGYKWRNYGPMNPLNFLEGLWTDPLRYFPENPRTYDDFFKYITRIFGWADQALNIMIRMRQSIQENTTNNWVSVEGVLPELDAMIGNSSTDNVFYERIDQALKASSLSQGNITSLQQVAAMTVNHLRETYTVLKTFVLTEYKVAARSAYGVSRLRDGQAYYRACLRWHLSVDMTPEQVHTLGLQEVDRIYGEMTTVMRRLNFTGTVKQFFHSLASDHRFFLKTPEDTINYYKNIIFQRVKPKLHLFFKNIPDMPIKVLPMPTDGPGGMYTFGTPDGSRPGVFYANVRRPEDNPTYSMPALVLHEADPGHHMQDIFSQAATGIPEFRKVIDYEKYFSIPMHFPFYTAYTEGWGLYAESLGEKDYLDIYQNDYELMGRYSMEIFRACRLVVDTGLHYYNWTRDRAIEYMLNYTADSEAGTAIEINRYITWPGQACAYKVGELKIRELRTHAQTELGEDFDIRDFHSVILDNGAMPLRILERLVNQWIDHTKAARNRVSTKETEEATLDKLMSDFFAWRLENSKEFATSYTYKYNDQLESYAYEALETRHTEAQEFLSRLQAIVVTDLSADKRISFDVLKSMLETFIAGYKWRNYGSLNPFNFLSTWLATPETYPIGVPFNTQGDFLNYVRRVELMPRQIDEMINLSKKAIELGHTYHNGSVERLVNSLDGPINQTPIESGLYAPFNTSGQKLFGNESQIMGDRLQTAIQLVLDKIKVVKTFLEMEYMPKTRKGFGVASLPNGSDLYRACLRWHTSLNITPEAVHEKGLDEVHRISRLMRQTMKRLGFPEDAAISDVYHNMTSNPKFLLANGDEILERYRQIIFERIQPHISKYFKDAPNLPIEVRASPSDGIGGSYSTGSEDGSRPGIFWANVRRMEDNPTYTMVSLSLHEAIPGHHLAESYSMVSDLPAFRKHMEWRSYSVPYFFPFFNSYVEGWALYAEYLGEEMGIYADDSELMGRYSDEMLRAVRLVVDTGIHYYNWSRQDAIDYMLNYTASTPAGAAIEIDRYSTWPGQACGYKLGEIEIKELRTRAENVLGDQFDLRDFHYTLLRSGPMPLDVLDRVVDAWIASVVTAHSTPAPPSGCPTDSTSAAPPLAVSPLWGLTAMLARMVIQL